MENNKAKYRIVEHMLLTNNGGIINRISWIFKVEKEKGTERVWSCVCYFETLEEAKDYVDFNLREPKVLYTKP